MKKSNIFTIALLAILSLNFTNVSSQTYYMDTLGNLTTINTCGAIIYDNGGSTADYLNNTNVTRTFCSTNGPIRVNISLLNLETSYDFLYIYDGPTTASPLLATLTGFQENNPAMFYTSSGTCLTLKFTSDNSVTMQNSSYPGGFFMRLGCEPQACNGNFIASDYCTDAIQVCDLNGYCGTTSGWYSIDAQYSDSYIGNNQFCGSIENNSWLKFIAYSTNVSIQITVSGCLIGQGVQMVLFTGGCDSLIRVGSNCFNQLLTGTNTKNFTGLIVGKTYYLMIDGFAGDVCDYSITALSGVQSASNFSIKDAKGSLGLGNYCASECGTFTVLTTGQSPIGYSWYSIPVGATGTDSILTFCPAGNTTIYCDIVGACGALVTDSFVVTSLPITFSGLPTTISCSSPPVTLSTDNQLTPCIKVKFINNSQTTPAKTITLFEGGISYWNTLTLDSFVTNYSYSYQGLSPSQTHALKFTGNTGTDISFTVEDCSNGAIIYTGVWGVDSTHLISGAGFPPNGISNYSTTCNGGLTTTDWGNAIFDPAGVSGPFPQSCSVTYNWDNQNGCIGSSTQNITVTSPNTSYSYLDNGNGNYTFTNSSSSSYNQYHWAFGDGTISTTTNSNHTFIANGTYVVVLTTNDSTGGSCMGYYFDTLIVTGVVSPAQCAAGFVTYPDTTINNVTVINSSTGTNLVYLWDFGDGDTSTLKTPTHIYSTSGPYFLCLTVDDGVGCTDMYCDSIGENGVVFNKQTGFTINVIAPPLVTQISEITNSTTGIAIYPNPTTADFIIELTEFSPTTKINIVSVDGKTVYTNKTIHSNKMVINAANWSDGVYIVKITDEKSNQVLKLIKR